MEIEGVQSVDEKNFFLFTRHDSLCFTGDRAFRVVRFVQRCSVGVNSGAFGLFGFVRICSDLDDLVRPWTELVGCRSGRFGGLASGHWGHGGSCRCAGPRLAWGWPCDHISICVLWQRGRLSQVLNSGSPLRIDGCASPSVVVGFVRVEDVSSAGQDLRARFTRQLYDPLFRLGREAGFVVGDADVIHRIPGPVPTSDPDRRT